MTTQLLDLESREMLAVAPGLPASEKPESSLRLHDAYRSAAATVAAGALPMRSSSIASLPGLTTVAISPRADAFTPITLTAYANQRLQSVSYGAVSLLPEGNVTLGGVRFSIPVGGGNVWTGAAATGPNPVF